MLCAGIVLCLVGTLHAQAQTTWTGPNGSKWSDPANWAGGVLPSPQIKAFVRQPGACVVDFEGAAAWQLDLAGGPIQIVDGGVLTVYDWFIFGYGAGDVGDNAGRLEVYDGGVLNCMQRIYVGYDGEGYLTVYEGGTVNIHAQLLGVGQHATGNGAVKMEGGSLNLLDGTNAQGLNLYTGKASIDFWGGTITLRNTPENQNYLTRAIGDGKIKAYDGVGEVVVDPNETPGRIVVRGVHPLKPNPRDDGLSSAGDVVLSWVLPDPCQPGTPVTVDVYFGTSADIGSAESPKIISKQNITSLSVRTEPKKRYYWAVDAYIGSASDPVLGPIFNFIADNIAPKVNAGADVVTWLEAGARTGNLDATITDDGAIMPYTVQWTVVSEPSAGAAVIQTATAEDTGITLSASGEYVLKVEAFDGEYTASDTVTINVYNDSCQAAQSLTDYQPLVGDLNGDCKVNDVDMALLQENWLKDNSLTEVWFKVG
jgi:hypothetical protein